MCSPTSSMPVYGTLIADCDVTTKSGTKPAVLLAQSDKYLQLFGESDLFTVEAAKKSWKPFLQFTSTINNDYIWQIISYCLCQVTLLCVVVVRKCTQSDVHVLEMIRFALNSGSANKTVQTIFENNKKLEIYINNYLVSCLNLFWMRGWLKMLTPPIDLFTVIF